MKRGIPFKPLFILSIIFTFCASCSQSNGNDNTHTEGSDTLESADTSNLVEVEAVPEIVTIDSNLYRTQVQALTNGDTTGKWPAKNQPIPLAGAILPNKRIIAYYGNLYSKGMGILGEYAPQKMLAHLDEEIKKWNE